MKQLSFSFFFILLFLLPLSAQTRNYEAVRARAEALGLAKAISVEFDAEAATTTIRGVGENFSDNEAKRAGVKAINFAAGLILPGNGLNKTPTEFLFSFWILSKTQRFNTATTVEFFVDNDRFPVSNFRYASRPRENMEYVNISLSRTQLVKIVSAKTARAALGNSQFTFTEKQIRLLKGLLEITEIG